MTMSILAPSRVRAAPTPRLRVPRAALRALALLATAMLGSASCASAQRPEALRSIQLPPGFSIAYYAQRVPGARSMALGAKGTLFVGSRSGSEVYALPDKNRDFRADTVLVIAHGLDTPNGVAFRDGSLWIAEISRVLRLDEIEDHLTDPPEPVVVYDKLPTETHHGWKFIRFGPDGKLYVPVGAPCNVCEPPSEIYETILRMNADGSGLEVFAKGVRNTVGFDWDPVTKELWFTDNGRDMLGDDLPPDELNHAPRAGLHFGFPYCHGRAIPDPEFGKPEGCAGFEPPAQELGPHVAALGMRFYTGTMFPPEYRNQIFIAEHGSWNRSRAIGYRVTLVRLKDGQATSYEPFASGWLDESKNRAWGRPVDLQVLPDGSLLVSDDHAGAIYRITYAKPAR